MYLFFLSRGFKYYTDSVNSTIESKIYVLASDWLRRFGRLKFYQDVFCDILSPNAYVMIFTGLLDLSYLNSGVSITQRSLFKLHTNISRS